MSNMSMEAVSAGLPTKSAKIRALAGAGFERADIARFLNIRYQHVRNVLEDEARKQGVPLKQETRPGDKVRIQVSANGRMVIPAEFRQFLDIDEGTTLTVELTQNGLVLAPIQAELKGLHEALSPYLDDSVSLADELIKERRKEAD